MLSQGLRVVVYHHVADRTPALMRELGVATPPAVFEAHVKRLARDYEVVDLEHVLSGAKLPRKAMLITFDDGYRSVADVALPTLGRLGLPSVLFASAAFLDPRSLPLDNLLCEIAGTAGHAAVEAAITGQPGAATSVAELLAIVAALPYQRRLGLGEELADRFGVDQAALRAASGLFLERADLAGLAALRCAIGNHTRSHLFCRAITEQDAVEHELASHRADLETWSGAPVRSFSYPYGALADATPFVERALRATGHELSFLVEARPNPPAVTTRFNRVSLDQRPAWRVRAELELLPRLRSVRDQLRPASAHA